MLDWDRLRPQGCMQYFPQPSFTPQTDPLNPWYPRTATPYTPPNNGTGGGGYYPPPPAKPSCFESKCKSCPYADKCKNKD